MKSSWALTVRWLNRPHTTTSTFPPAYLDEVYQRRTRERRRTSLEDLYEGISKGKVLRLRPKLMTFATTVNALLPLLILPANYMAWKTFEASLQDVEHDLSRLPPRRIDILNQATGITFDEAVAESVGFELQGRRICVIGREALLKNKRATARAQDLADLKALESCSDASNC